MRIIRSIVLALTVSAAAFTFTFAQWPTTCVELNDIVEAHLGNDGNVGIYQQVYGDQAEAACQNDHRDDVQASFEWALPDAAVNSSSALPEQAPVQTNGYRFSGKGNDLRLERVFIEGSRYIVSTTQKHCIIASLSHSGRWPEGHIIATNYN